MAPPVPLGREVRDWVLVPLTLTIALMMVMRQYAMVSVDVLFLFFRRCIGFSSPAHCLPAPPLTRPPPSSQTLPQTLLAAPSSTPGQKADLKEVRERTALARAALLRGAGAWIGAPGLAARKAFFTAPSTGLLTKKPVTKSAHEAMMTNPDAVTGMLKQSLGGIVPQVAMGTFVSTFFSGFILGRAPVPLPPSFRAMLQRGVDLPGLDVSYFTSLSFYILLLFGLRGVFTLLFADAALDEAALQRAAMTGGFGGGGSGGAGPPPDMGKAFEAEKAALALFEPASRLEAGGGGGARANGGSGGGGAPALTGSNAAAAAVLRARLRRAPVL
jgi:ER membrane protein complex subunit 3